jgi:hypothetical protein
MLIDEIVVLSRLKEKKYAWRLVLGVSVYPGLKALAGFRLKPVLRRGGLCR